MQTFSDLFTEPDPVNVYWEKTPRRGKYLPKAHFIKETHHLFQRKAGHNFFRSPLAHINSR